MPLKTTPLEAVEIGGTSTKSFHAPFPFSPIVHMPLDSICVFEETDEHQPVIVRCVIR